MPARVLHVSETTAGGIGTVLSDLVPAQARAGWQVAVAAPADDGLARLVHDAGGRYAPWVPGVRPGPRLPVTLAALRRVIRDVDPDLVHLHSSMAGMCGRLVVRRRRPTIFQPHSWSFFAVGGAAQRGALTWERVGARWTDVVLCVSEDERRHAERAGVRSRCVVVPNGVDLERFRPAGDAQKAQARRRLGLGPEPLAVCLGRLHRQKGQHALLDAWPAVLAAQPGARLALVGEGPDRGPLEAREPERTTFVGQTGAVLDWLTAADVVVQPSTWEGMSLSLLEAMACGCSVVVTDVTGMREVVRDGCGAVVAQGDPAALAEALALRLGDPALAAREGAAGRCAVERHHDLQVQRRQVLALSAELVGPAG